MEFSDLFTFVAGSFIFPVGIILLFVMFTRNKILISKDELDIEKECLKAEVEEYLNKIRIHWKLLEPHFHQNHIDGPVLHLSTDNLIWLTWSDRFLLWFKLTSIDSLNIKYCRKEIEKI